MGCSMENELDLRELLHIVQKRIWIILLITILATTISAILSFFILSPVYQANTTLYVGKEINVEGNLNYQDVLLGGQLVKDYRELAKSRLVTTIVAAQLSRNDITAGQISSMLTVNSKNDTRIFEISVQNTDPVLASEIANRTAQVFKEKAIELLHEQNVQVIDVAVTPTSPIKPNKLMNVAIAMMLGLMLGLGVAFLIEFLDNTIKSVEDVQKHLGLPVIGSIPKFDDLT